MARSAVLQREASVPGEPDAVGLYLREVGRYRLLDRDGEARLATTVQAGIESLHGPHQAQVALLDEVA